MKDGQTLRLLFQMAPVCIGPRNVSTQSDTLSFRMHEQRKVSRKRTSLSG